MFDHWMMQVDKVLLAKYEMTADEMPDVVNWNSLFEQDFGPRDAVRIAEKEWSLT